MTNLTGAAPITLRAATQSDVAACSAVFYDSFAAIAERHAMPIEPIAPAFAAGAMHHHFLATPGIAGVVAERDGEVVGLAFCDERDPVAGIGPVSVAPGVQDAGVGRALMEALLAREAERGAVGVRLVQTAYHYRSFALYAKLGFAARELLTVFNGQPPGVAVPGTTVRPATEADVASCAALCRAVHGHDRSGALRGAIAMGTARVIERDGAVSAYATSVGYQGHAVGHEAADIIALLSSTDEYAGLGVIVPSRHTPIVDWCLRQGLEIVQQSVLMTIGDYADPQGAWLPSIAY